MRKTLAIAVFAASTFQISQSGAITNKRNFHIEPLVENKGPVICTLKNPNRIVFSRGLDKKSLVTNINIYEKDEKPLAISCNIKRTIVLTNKKIAILPGYIQGKNIGSFDMMVVQNLGKTSEKGLASWKIHGDNIYLITKDNIFWKTNINSFEKNAYRIPEIENDSVKKIFVFNGIVFIAQPKNDGRDFLVAINISNDDLFIKSFSSNVPINGPVIVNEEYGVVRLTAKDIVVNISVSKKGNLENIVLK